ncbi:hypothetical protein [Brevundimonas sp.]|uniref:hypothetical protein n=1 Tax=Brevundimonas sp. TaxID=1871086 RepID=UPI002D75ECA6|nr:hypothetical protein [Brevundimonas sp.]HYC74686.1 hypothetical protein [Brevundimonas sp.]
MTRRTLWLNRGAALAAVGLTLVALTSALAAGRDLRAVTTAGDRPGGAPITADKAAPWTPGRPLLRRNGATAEIAIGEHLNGRLAELGLTVLAVDASNLRPLGGGLHLAEVRVQALGDAAASAAVANWIAVNREAVRLKSLTLGLGPTREGTVALVLLMVIA